MQRLRVWDSRIHVHKPSEKNLRQAFHQLDILKDKLGLSDAIVEKAAYIYRKVCERRLVRGRTIKGMLTAAVYIACRETGTPRTLNDIAAISNIKRKDVARNYRTLVLELDIKIPEVDPMKWIVKVANKLGVSEKTKHHAMDIMAEVVKREITSGKVPMGLAAIVLYASCMKTGESIHQTSIAAASGVTEVTIRNRFKDIRSRLDI